MQTDELRAELTDLANEVEPFEGNLAAVHHRVARRRAAIGSVVAVAVLVVIGGAVALTRPAADRVHVAGNGAGKEVPARDLPRVDATVLLPAGATEGDAAEVQNILGRAGVVEHYTTPAVGSLAFAPRTPGSPLDGVSCVDASARGFVVELGNEPNALQNLSAAVGDRAEVSNRRGESNIELFMRVKASPAQAAALHDALDHDPDITDIVFIDHQDAFKKFKSMFADQPVLIESESPEGLPESFQMRTRDAVTDDTIAARYDHYAGVDSIITRTNRSSLILDVLRREDASRDLGPNDVQLFMKVEASPAQIHAIANRLESDGRVISHRLLSKDPNPEHLPTSFRITLEDPADALVFDAEYAALPGVAEQITGPGHSSGAPCPPEP